MKGKEEFLDAVGISNIPFFKIYDQDYNCRLRSQSSRVKLATLQYLRRAESQGLSSTGFNHEQEMKIIS